MMKSIKFLFNNNTEKRIKVLMESVTNQYNEIKKLKKEYDELNHWYLDYSSLLNRMSEDLQASIWKKDIEHKYIIANPTHCKNFFNIPGTSECLEFIKGKTDKYLINEIYRDNGFNNTFGEICTMSDEYVVKKGDVVHLLEAGLVDDNQVLLYLIKIPQYDSNGNVIGTHGIAWDFTSKCSFIMKSLNRWIYDGLVDEIYSNDNVFCYALQPSFQECDIFNHLCPFDRNNQTNKSQVNVCELGCG